MIESIYIEDLRHSVRQSGGQFAGQTLCGREVKDRDGFSLPDNAPICEPCVERELGPEVATMLRSQRTTITDRLVFGS